MKDIGLKASLMREIRQLTSRKIYLCAMVLAPVIMLVFLVTLFGEGLPLRVPSAMVDLDHSAMSREVTRTLKTSELISLDKYYDSYDDALASVRRGEIYSFFVIPTDFERNVIGGNAPTLEFYSNMTYFVPATLSFKGFKTVAVSTTGGIVKNKLLSMGASPETADAMIQPVAVQDHGIGNPWTNYSYYLCPSFMAGILALMIMLVTSYSITMEIKYGTSRQWLETAHGSMFVALLGKLIPQWVCFVAVGTLMESVFFGYCHFPNHGNLWYLMLAMVLMVTACQFLALFISCLVPNPRLALSLCSLLGILSFSFCGFSFPMENMYGWVALFGYMMPVQHYFSIYGVNILNGFELYYTRWIFICLLLYPLLGWCLCGRLKKACLKPVYVP